MLPGKLNQKQINKFIKQQSVQDEFPLLDIPKFRSNRKYVQFYDQMICLAKQAYDQNPQFHNVPWQEVKKDKDTLHILLNKSNLQQVSDFFLHDKSQLMDQNIWQQFIIKLQASQQKRLRSKPIKKLKRQNRFSRFFAQKIAQGVKKKQIQAQWKEITNNQQTFFKENTKDCIYNGFQNIYCQFCFATLTQKSFYRHLYFTHAEQMYKIVKQFVAKHPNQKYVYFPKPPPKLQTPQYVLAPTSVILQIPTICKQQQLCLFTKLQLSNVSPHSQIDIAKIQISKQQSDILSHNPFYKNYFSQKQFLVDQQQFNRQRYQQINHLIYDLVKNYIICIYAKITYDHPHTSKNVLFNIQKENSKKSLLKTQNLCFIKQRCQQQIQLLKNNRKIVGREKQLKYLRQIISKNKMTTQVLFVVGASGQGKTLCIKHVLQENMSRFIQVNLFQKIIWDEMLKAFAQKIHGHKSHDPIQVLQSFHRNLSGSVIFLVQQADNLSEGVLKQLLKFPKFYYIFTSNMCDLKIQQYVKKLIFPIYTLPQITQIVKKICLQHSYFDHLQQWQVQNICAKGFQKGGDLRKILFQLSSLFQENIDSMMNGKRQQHKLVTFFNKLGTHSKRLLFSLVQITKFYDKPIPASVLYFVAQQPFQKQIRYEHLLMDLIQSDVIKGQCNQQWWSINLNTQQFSMQQYNHALNSAYSNCKDPILSQNTKGKFLTAVDQTFGMAWQMNLNKVQQYISNQSK